MDFEWQNQHRVHLQFVTGLWRPNFQVFLNNFPEQPVQYPVKAGNKSLNKSLEHHIMYSQLLKRKQTYLPCWIGFCWCLEKIEGFQGTDVWEWVRWSLLSLQTVLSSPSLQLNPKLIFRLFGSSFSSRSLWKPQFCSLGPRFCALMTSPLSIGTGQD